MSRGANHTASTDIPRVSVIIPAYNAALFIGDTIESVLRQTFRSYEIVLVDDGSRDDTAEVVRQFGASVRYIRQENTGVSSARNRAIQASRGDLIAFLDHDDCWAPTKLEKQVALLDARPDVGVVYSDAEVVDVAGNVLARFFESRHPHRGLVTEPLVRENFIPLLTVVLRRQCLTDAVVFDPDLCISEEYDLFLKLSESETFDYVDEPLAKYLIHEHNLSRNVPVASRELKHVLSSFVKRHSHVEGIYAREIEQVFAGTDYDLGRFHLAQGDGRCARPALRRAAAEPAYRVRARLMMAGSFVAPLASCLLRVWRRFRGYRL